jgi:hypothetical protein
MLIKEHKKKKEILTLLMYFIPKSQVDEIFVVSDLKDLEFRSKRQITATIS